MCRRFSHGGGRVYVRILGAPIPFLFAYLDQVSMNAVGVSGNDNGSAVVLKKI